MTILPPAPWAIICAAANFVQRKTPRRLTSITRMKSSSLICASGTNGKIPALFTSTSSFSKCSTVLSTSRCTLGPSAMSIEYARAEPSRRSSKASAASTAGQALPVRNDHVRPRLVQPRGDRQPDPHRAARHDGGLARHVEQLFEGALRLGLSTAHDGLLSVATPEGSPTRSAARSADPLIPPPRTP